MSLSRFSQTLRHSGRVILTSFAIIAGVIAIFFAGSPRFTQKTNTVIGNTAHADAPSCATSCSAGGSTGDGFTGDGTGDGTGDSSCITADGCGCADGADGGCGAGCGCDGCGGCGDSGE